jgi:hypothetical protein
MFRIVSHKHKKQIPCGASTVFNNFASLRPSRVKTLLRLCDVVSNIQPTGKEFSNVFTTKQKPKSHLAGQLPLVKTFAVLDGGNILGGPSGKKGLQSNGRSSGLLQLPKKGIIHGKSG